MTVKRPNQFERSGDQAEKFKAMAKELEANDDEAAFDAKLKALSKAQEKPAKSKNYGTSAFY
jgi:hypothetical protein